MSAEYVHQEYPKWIHSRRLGKDVIVQNAAEQVEQECPIEGKLIGGFDIEWKPEDFAAPPPDSGLVTPIVDQYPTGPRDATPEEIAADDKAQDAKAEAEEEARDERTDARRRKKEAK